MRCFLRFKNIYSIIFFFGISMHSFAQIDQFAKIGGQTYQFQKDQLIEPQPPKLPTIQLPVGIIPSAIPFYKAPATKEWLQSALDSIRTEYAPYMKNYAPPLKSKRNRVAIEKMQWRIETVEDQQNIEALKKGGGSWQEVTIPHYGPPVGHAVTYYYKEVQIDEELLVPGSLFVCFKGVDYKAEVYFNGQFCGYHQGFFAPFEFNVHKYAKVGKNTLLVKVTNEPTTTGSVDENGNYTVGDKIYAAGGLGYDEPINGWHVCPPAMGISQDCYLESRPVLFIQDIFVRPLPQKNQAEVWLEINNTTKLPKNITLQLSLFGQNFKDTVFINTPYQPATTYIPGVGDLVKPTDWQQKILPMQYGTNYLKIPIDIKKFRTWEPSKPWLYNIQVSIVDENKQAGDHLATHFGMRSFEMDTLQIPKGRMFLNGKFIRLRGANSMGFEQNDVKKKDWKQLVDDILLAKLCNMNFLRFTQRPVQSEVYDFCDQLGMLNQTDLPLFGGVRINQFAEVVKQAEEMERLVRSHPSTIMVTYINERFPNAEGSPQRNYSETKSIHQLFTALDQAVLLSNPDRVIKNGDGDYDPPTPSLPDAHCYNTWYNGHALDLGKFNKGYWQLIKPNWYYGCGEFGAEGLDPYNTMKKYYPADWLPKNAAEDKLWNANKISKSQTNTFHYMWYPTQVGLDHWIEASQAYQSWAVGFVTEAFRRDERNVSCAVHLFIDAWPAGWMKAIMDVDRQPKKAFFSYRDALTPLMASLRTDRFTYTAGDTAQLEAWICNDLNKSPQQYTIGYEVIVQNKSIVKQYQPANIGENKPVFQGTLSFPLPDVAVRSNALVRLGVFDENHRCVHFKEVALTVFPKQKPVSKKIFTYAQNTSNVTSIAAPIGMQVVHSMKEASVVFIDQYNDYVNNKTTLDAFVEAGGTVFFSQLDPGKYTVYQTDVEVKKTIMGEYYFANIAAALLQDKKLSPNDFFLWYDKRKDYIQPVLTSVFKQNGWEPLVTTGLCNFAGEDPAGYLGAGYLRHGKGKFLLCQVSLVNRIKENPAGAVFLKKIL